ncbi:MAG: hypothetical protein MI975_19015 [Cytophagales bacterium]|nr:hypothetical protein [Cytophagales bacterium]
MLDKRLYFLIIPLLSLASYAQNGYDYYVENIPEAKPETPQLPDSVSRAFDVTKTPVYRSTTEGAYDSIARIEAFRASIEDSLQSYRFLREIERKRAALLDTLATLELPGDLARTVDSLRAAPSAIRQFQSKIDLQKFQSADTSINRYVDMAKEFVLEQKSALEGKTLLPDDFYNKLEKLSSNTGNRIDPDVLAKVQNLTSGYELDYQKYLSTNKLQELVDLDLDFLDNLDGYLGRLNGYTGRFDEYMERLNVYMGTMDVEGLVNPGKLDRYSQALDLPGNLRPDGMPDLTGYNTGEIEQLISDYGTLDAGQLDQRIDRLAGKYEGFNELQSQASALEEMKSGQMGQFDQLKSMSGQKFDQQMAMKKGQVLANDYIMNNTDLVETAMKEVNAFKKKYSIVTNSNYKEEDVEKPVKHVAMEKRFYFGGDFQLLPGEPFGIDFSGLLGYRIANRTSAGLAGSIRYEFRESDNYVPDFTEEPVYGGRAFVQYKAIKSYFIQGEAEAVNVYNTSNRKVWEINYLAGIGRSINIGNKLRLNITFLYHINNKGSLAHDKPYVIRVGLSSL